MDPSLFFFFWLISKSTLERFLHLEVDFGKHISFIGHLVNMTGVKVSNQNRIQRYLKLGKSAQLLKYYVKERKFEGIGFLQTDEAAGSMMRHLN